MQLRKEAREKKQKASIQDVLWCAAVSSWIHSHAGICRQYWASHLKNGEIQLKKGEESPETLILRDME